MKRIRVPEGMLKAAQDAAPSISEDEIKRVRRRLEAALLWLSNNPQVPTDEQAAEIWKKDVTPYWSFAQPVKQIIEAWQRRCFQEEGPSERAKSLALRLAGNSFTSQDADFLIEQIMAATTPGYAPPFRGAVPEEPEIPAEIEDIMFPDLAPESITSRKSELNDLILDAYRRGLRKGG